MYPITDAARALFEANKAKVVRITGSTVRILPTDIAVYNGDELIYQSGDGKSLKLYSGSSEIYDNQGTRTIILYSGDKPIYMNDEAGMPVQIDITSSDVRQGDFSIDRYSCNGQALEIGTAISSEMALRLDNSKGQFDGVIFEGVELFVQIGISDLADGDGEISWVPCGYFTCDQQPRNLNTLSLNALDRMMRFDRKLASGAVTLPKTVAELVAAGCAACNVALGQSLSGLPNASYSVTALPATQDGITWRDIIRWCAGLMGANAWIDWNGELRFSWYNNETGYVCTTDNRFSSDLYENPIIITGVKFTDSDETNTTYIAGTDDYAIDLSDNSLVNADNADALLPNIYVPINGFAYTPFSASVLAAPYLWPMDRVTFTDRNGKSHVSVLTNVNLSVNGSTDIAAVGESAEVYSYGKTSSFTSRQQAALRRIQHVVSSEITDAVESATAQITGALGGYVRFMYDANGAMTEILIMNAPDIATATKVWRWNQGGFGYSSNGYQGPYTTAITQDGAIVANFITAGILNAAIVKAGILGDAAGANYWNMATGEFKLSGGAELGDSTVGDVLDAIDAAILNVDVEYAQNQSATTAPTSGWSTAAPTWREGYYIWQRTATTTNDGTTYSAPTCISGRDGVDGADGTSVTILGAYDTLAELQAAHPIGNPGDGYMVGTDLYVWNDSTSAWQDVGRIQGPEGPQGVQGQAGANGINTATINLYQRATSAPTRPSASLTYTFETATLIGALGNWSTGIPNGTDPCWVIAATAASSTSTDTIAPGEWSSPVKLVENGEDGANGTNGTNGLNQATIYLYKRSASTPTKPSVSVTYTFATGALSSVPAGWSRSVPGGTDPCWLTSAVAISSGETDTIAASEWAGVIKLVENGETGAQGIGVSEIVEQYYLSTSSTTQTGGSWSTNQPAWASGKYIWTRSQVTWTNNTITYTAPVLAQAINGANSSASNAQSTANAASSAVTTLDNSLNQQGVFNRLTNNGQTQGIYLKDGKLYINATYIDTGTLVADIIKGGTLTLGGSNNTSGTLMVKDASNNTIGEWNNNGITVLKGALNISYIRQYYDDTYFFDQNGYVLKRVANKGLSSEHTSTISITGEAIDINTQNATNNEIRIISTQSGNLYEMGISPRNGIDWKTNGNRFIYVTPIPTGIGTGVILYTDFIVTSGNTKSKVVSTDQYSDRLLYCYETPSPMYGDVGEAIIGDDGLCYVTIDPLFAQTITTDNYQVFLQRYGAGDCYVQERKGGWFVVSGTPGLAFGWEIKGKQADIADVGLHRLDRNDEKFTVPTQTYGEDAAQHIIDIQKERIPA